MKRFLPFLSIVLLLVGCRSFSKDNTNVLKDVWRLEQAQINSFDPMDAYHAYHIQLIKQLFNTLTDIDTTGMIVPSLAESWHSDDGCRWVFKLRDDVLFINDSCFESMEERLFTAQDVKFTFERLLSKESKSLGISYFTNISGVTDYRNGISNTIQGIEVIDDHTIVFHLCETNLNFPNLLSLPFCSIVKEKSVSMYDPKVKPVGTGPFQLEKYLPDRNVSLVKNDDYWEHIKGVSLPYIEKIEILLAPDDNYSFLLFKNKKTDFLELNLPLRKQYETTTFSFKTLITFYESTQLNFYLFNLSKIEDPNVRKGISFAIDRNKLQRLIGDEGEVTYSLYPKMFRSIHTIKDVLKTDENKAGELLSGHKMRLKLVSFDDLLSRAMAARVKEDLARFDVSVDIESVPFSVLADRLSSGDYDMIQLYWGMLYADPDHFLTPFKAASFPPNGNNFNKYTNAIFEELIKTALFKDGEEQAMCYRTAEEVILDDMPFVLLYYNNISLLSNGLYSLPVNPLMYKFYKYANS